MELEVQNSNSTLINKSYYYYYYYYFSLIITQLQLLDFLHIKLQQLPSTLHTRKCYKAKKKKKKT